MREILFRGKHSDNEWQYGSLVVGINGKTYISSNGEAYPTEVYTETVGQYTGLTDKNGRKIFEGDILSAHFDESYPDDETLLLVGNNGYAFTLKEGYSAPEMINDADMRFFDETFVVIGNVFDNPELLEGELK